MAKSFKLPDLGEGIHEGEVLAVMVSVGDSGKEGDPIFEVETDKAAVEIPSPFTASVAEIMVKPGDIVKVGDVLMTFSDGEAAKPDEKAKPPEIPSETVEKPAAPVRDKGPVPASPATRRLARQLDVDLHEVTPGGQGGCGTPYQSVHPAGLGAGPSRRSRLGCRAGRILPNGEWRRGGLRRQHGWG